MDANERFEYMADRFYKETGYMAPGKDSPAYFGGVDSIEKRTEMWQEWVEHFYSTLFERNFSCGSIADTKEQQK